MLNRRSILTLVLLMLASLVLVLWLIQRGEIQPVQEVGVNTATSGFEEPSSESTSTKAAPTAATISPVMTAPRSTETQTAAPSTTTAEPTQETANSTVDHEPETMTPSVEAEPTLTLTPLPAPPTGAPLVEDSTDRSCPDPSPAKPDYFHYYLSGASWPRPDPELGSHFWLTKPFSGGGRLLITEWFPYGYDAGGRYLLHNGIDMAEPQGTPILAVSDGTVIVAGDDYTALYGWRCDWYGHLVVIELEDQWQSEPVYVLYGHVQNIGVEVGQKVSRGDIVAEVGVGGAATLPHLHFEVRVGENTFAGTRNPLLWIEPPPTRGLIVGRLVDPEGRPWQGVTVQAIGKSDNTSDHTTWTYLGDPKLLVNPDEAWAENFIFGEMEPGHYDLFVSIQGVVYSIEAEVESGGATSIEIVTEPYNTPTPNPPSSD